ncbi:hypothetical protein MMC10_010882 [Thelotrema lepadinum]|nr:hypothetical protein [Thelotrema lepadinum]
MRLPYLLVLIVSQLLSLVLASNYHPRNVARQDDLQVRDLENELQLRSIDEGSGLAARDILDESDLYRRAFLKELYVRDLAETYKRGIVAARDPDNCGPNSGPHVGPLGNNPCVTPPRGTGGKHMRGNHHTWIGEDSTS